MHRWLAMGGPEYTLVREQWVPGDRASVFAFFLDPHNLPRITPPDMAFRIVAMEPDIVREGTLIDYRLRVMGGPCRWRTLIEEWEPGVRFVDRQLNGPYVLWRHTHEFVECGGGVLLRDIVRYRLPFGPLGVVVHRLLVRRDVERIFAYRQRCIADLYSGGRILAPPPAAQAR